LAKSERSIGRRVERCAGRTGDIGQADVKTQRARTVQHLRWIQRRANAGTIRGTAGHVLRLAASDYLKSASIDPKFHWSVEDQEYEGEILEWVPGSPGLHRVLLRSTIGQSRVIDVSGLSSTPNSSQTLRHIAIKATSRTYY
jgi:hypothetical protein